jgi:hypothetical protein
MGTVLPVKAKAVPSCVGLGPPYPSPRPSGSRQSRVVSAGAWGQSTPSREGVVE